VYGARVLEIQAQFEGVLDLAQAAATAPTVALVNSVNPYRIEGQATGAYEIVDVIGVPDVVALPTGNGGNITAYWRGFTRYASLERAEGTPRVIGVQAVGADPLVQGHPIPEPRTVASAIRIGRPATWEPALDAARVSGGRVMSVADERILEAQREVARREGIFCEPASAAPVAGLKQSVAEGWLSPDVTCVAILTGHGLKDPETAAGAAWREGLERVPASVEAVTEAILRTSRA
jgi:threonine synthase